MTTPTTPAPALHELKCWPEVFHAMRRGEKRFEFRKDDRNFQVGDVLFLNEWKPHDGPGMGAFGEYTGEGDRYRVTFKLAAGQFGVPDGYCVLSVERIAPTPPPESSERGKGGDDKRIANALSRINVALGHSWACSDYESAKHFQAALYDLEDILDPDRVASRAYAVTAENPPPTSPETQP